MNDKMREEFEAWYRANPIPGGIFGEQCCWMSWQAARASQPSAPVVRDGWKQIETAPKEGLVDILNAGRRYAGCHFDSICSEYRHITACGVLIHLRESTHWMPIPKPPEPTK